MDAVVVILGSFDSRLSALDAAMRPIQVKLLFAGERQLCDQVFECSQSLRDTCFAAKTKNSLATLLSFGEAIAMSKRSPEKLFILLDMYEIMCELQADLRSLCKLPVATNVKSLMLSLKS
ncbi:hypothetical protein GUJ93_ZPchr0016g2639 [Zizania palustris]|uniref:Exocyst subunit Exo70 family protein n=1 Tax=Zizania palustris TaxID=103762 RepID=A0A8J5W726_ZIZPA|nr:hypothetical protein GUJ93_ZPchr0016g2639 [Zizania palustris]